MHRKFYLCTMMKRAFLILGFGMLCNAVLFGQDTIRVMYYNLLNFPDVSPERAIELRKIVGYAQPDVLVVNELLSATGANLILNDALNVWGMSDYAAAEYVNGPDTDNMLFYNSTKLGLISQEQLATGLRDISEYRLFYKSPSLSALSDTVFMTVYSVHLKAGSGFFNQRKEEVLVLKYHLNGLNNPENIVVGGDFNFYSGNESGCLALRETGNIDLFDPITSIGDWSGNFSYRNIHTQSTRTAPLGDGAGGGLDDRFDLIFVSQDALNNTNGLEFIEGSYTALGQDGNRFNGAINAPFNPSIPDSIASALYFMSDHLPVMLDLKTDYTAAISEYAPQDFTAYWNNGAKKIWFSKPVGAGIFMLYTIRGELVQQIFISNQQEVNLEQGLAKGIFFWVLQTETNQFSGKIVASS